MLTQKGTYSWGLAEKLYLDFVYETTPKNPQSNTDT